jgi:predicted flap endonuclease-1-like 5' DNA nuclease
MATKTKKTTKKSSNLNSSLVNVTTAAIKTTVENGEKWQDLTKKLIKKSEPVRKMQMNMVFDSAKAVKSQVNLGKERMVDLVGYDNAAVAKVVNRAKENPVAKKVIHFAGGIIEKVSENPIIKKVEKTSGDLKKMSIAKFNEVKEDVLGQAQKILNKGEALIEDAKNPKKTTKQIKTKGAKKVAQVRKTTKAKTSTAKKKTVSKVAVVKTTAQKVVKGIKTEGAANVADIKETGKKNVAAIKKETKKEILTSAKDDLKIIHGIGPKLEMIFNKKGINTFAEFAKTDKTKIETILEEAGPMFKNINTSDWQKQAEVGAEEGVEALIKWVARYRTA